MVNRVLLDANGLRISKPGYDVFSAGLPDLLFSSDWNGVPFHMRGSVALGNTSIFYGKTFGTVPFASYVALIGGIYWTLGNLSYLFYAQSGSELKVNTFSDRFTMTSALGGTLYYTIWDFDA